MTVGQLLRIIEKNDIENEAEIHISDNKIAFEIASVGVTTRLTAQGDELHDVYLWGK